MQRVCVFCGSNMGKRPAYRDAARDLGRALAERGWGLVYGGGGVGLMGVVSEAAMEGGGEVIGIIPEEIMAREVGRHDVTELKIVSSMHERKALMADLADAFVGLPGGLGTLEELFEIVTWAQLGLHSKAVGVLDVEGFFGPLFELLDHAAAEGFVRPEHRALVVSERDPGRLLDLLEDYRPPQVEKWGVEP